MKSSSAMAELSSKARVIIIGFEWEIAWIVAGNYFPFIIDVGFVLLGIIVIFMFVFYSPHLPIYSECSTWRSSSFGISIASFLGL